MSSVLKDLSVPALVAAIKANLFEYYVYLGGSPGAELHDSPGITWLLTGLPHPFLNAVLRTQVAQHRVDDTIAETLAHFKSKAMTRFSWYVELVAQPADLGERLAAHGLTYAEGAPGMAVDLSVLREIPTLAGLAIEHVEGAGTLKEWVRVASAGFGLPASSQSTCVDLFTGLGFDLPLRNYVGYRDGEPVATAQLFLGAGVAGIYVVATIPEARRKGIGAAMMLAPLRQARALGYRIGILHSSPMGLGVYCRLGFQEYCRIRHYTWSAKTSQ